MVKRTSEEELDLLTKEFASCLSTLKDRKDISILKAKLAKKHKFSRVPRTLEIFCKLGKEDAQHFAKLMMSKPMRTLSGVAPVAVMCKPFPCPVQAECTYCPGGVGSFFGDTPQSYPGGSPAHLRGARNHYDAYLQVMNRLEQYALLGQDFSKVELIVLGGTFTTYPIVYRDEFVGSALKAMNDFGDMFFDEGEFLFKKFVDFFELPADLRDEVRMKRIHEKLLKIKDVVNLDEEKLRNETAKVRCVLNCIETRSDCCGKVHINDILRLAGTRVEIGVQTIYDDVLKKIKRGHLNDENIMATAMLKDAYFKVGYHMMLGLPGSSYEQDVSMMKTLFSDEKYKPDALKLYPCMVFEGTPLYDAWKKDEYEPIDAFEAARRIVEFKRDIPTYCRVMRVQRDIPTKLVGAGVEMTNLRQVVHEMMEKQNIKCRCIRCREPKSGDVDWSNVTLNRVDYAASGGKEVFLSFDDLTNDYLLGFVRLRIPGDHVYREEIVGTTAGIREIHVYGRAMKVGSGKKEVQHRGYGVQLMEEAERIAKEEFDRDKMVVISGIGVREWFRKKFLYKNDGPYVSRKL